MIMIKGSDLEQALIRAHHANYNRSFNDLSKIDERMWHVINELMTGCDDEERANVLDNIDNDWRNALIPVDFLMFHKHRQMQPCETHVRVSIGGGIDMICDITMEDWDMFRGDWTDYVKYCENIEKE